MSFNQKTDCASFLNIYFCWSGLKNSLLGAPLQCNACGNCSANFLRLLKLSAPSWLTIPGSISATGLVSAGPVRPRCYCRGSLDFGIVEMNNWPLIVFSSSIPATLLTASFFFFLIKRTLKLSVISFSMYPSFWKLYLHPHPDVSLMSG